MRIGLFVQTNDLDRFVEAAKAAAEGGFASLWTSQIFSLDALTAIAVAGREVPGLDWGTGVVPTYPRHPMALAGQAMTAHAATGGRLTLGIGLSHQVVVEGMWGYDYSRPARHMREYLAALVPLLEGEPASVDGETLKANGAIDVAGGTGAGLVVAALGPRMLELAGSRTDGTVTWMTGPATIESHIAPSIRAAAEAAGRPAPRVVMALPVAVTDDPDAAREKAAKAFAVYGQLPSYRAMLDREGAGGPADVVIAGDEEEVRAAVEALPAAGVTEFVASLFENEERTTELLASLL
jgi:F420-dependent oxidoreductase-like protein